MKVAHFNIADLHAFHSLANRYDYNSEVLGIVERIGRLALSYRERGYKCIALLNGDVAHKGTNKDALNEYATQAIKLLISYFDETYLNFGNHEISYYKNNPIFKFIKEFEDVRIRTHFPFITPLSLTPDIRVVTRLEYEDFEIIFTPYGFEPITEFKKEITHLIMHDDLLSDTSYGELGSKYPEYKIHRRHISVGLYDYVYCGHMHRIHEKWMHGDTVVYNLASLGRSNASEVDDAKRHRLIPIILSEDGYFDKVVEESITLHKRADIVDEEKVLLSQAKYLEQKDRKINREALSISRAKNPMEALEEDVRASGKPELMAILEILKTGRPITYTEVRLRAEDFIT